MKSIVLQNNQSLEEINEHNVVLTFSNSKRLINKEEQDEIFSQISSGIYCGAVSPDVKWKAYITF